METAFSTVPQAEADGVVVFARTPLLLALVMCSGAWAQPAFLAFTARRAAQLRNENAIVVLPVGIIEPFPTC
jgi:hypothetical protein